MGAQCVKSTPKEPVSPHIRRLDSLESQLKNCEENLQFSMTLSHLKLINMADKVKEIRFYLEQAFEMVYNFGDFCMQEHLIKSEKIHKAQFKFPANSLEKKIVNIKILNFSGKVIESLDLKLTQLCTGPIHHDHLLKELKGRFMFDLQLYQKINISAKCKDLKILLLDKDSYTLDDLSYRFILTVILKAIQTDIDEKTLSTQQGYLSNDGCFEEQTISTSISNKLLKQSNFRFQFFQALFGGSQLNENAKIIHSIFIPYRKFQNYQTFTTYKKKQADYMKKTLMIKQELKDNGKVIGSISFEFEVQTSILYAEQMECLIFSQIGVSSVSPTASFQNNDALVDELKSIYKSVKKIKRLGTKQKEDLIKNIDEIYLKFQKSNQEIFTSEEELYEKQTTLVSLLYELASFFSNGEDILNERLWRTINYIVHKPEFSARYLTLHQNQNTKKELYLHFYRFIIDVFEKIIVSTESGITFHELQCIQKFIAFAYFRFPWIQDKILHVLKRKQDPIITEEKLIQFGASSGCRSPSKSYVYDWEINVFRKIEDEKAFKQMLERLDEVSSKYEEWDELLFNRQEQDLFYGLYLQIWNEAEISLKDMRGRILWEYFPNYGQLLSCFLGEMNSSNISDLSSLFKQCSNKLVLNEKLLNTFLVQLFPKTYLFQITGVLKCLSLLQSYFQVILKQHKKLPHDFNFNFFYTGIKSIFDQNHSYLVVKTLQILYKYYQIFTQQFKRTLNNYLLSNAFYGLFLHWCTNVRKIFYHLLCYRIMQKKVTNPQEATQNNIKSSKSIKNKENQNSQENMYNYKLRLYMRAIEHNFEESKRQKMSQKSKLKISHCERMKQKLQERKRKQAEQIQKCVLLGESEISQDGKNYSLMIRKNSCFNEGTELIQFARLRKMSATDDTYTQKIDNKYIEYCGISLKEYEQVKKVQNSSVQVDKLASRLVQGEIQT